MPDRRVPLGPGGPVAAGGALTRPALPGEKVRLRAAFGSRRGRYVCHCPVQEYNVAGTTARFGIVR